jgi:hypothetical protein
MDTFAPKCIIPNTNGFDAHHNHKESPHSPSKVQKTANSIAGFSGNILNIPDFIGPTPSFPSTQNHDSSYHEYLHQQERNNQENQISPHHSTEQHTTNHQQNVSPNST